MNPCTLLTFILVGVCALVTCMPPRVPEMEILPPPLPELMRPVQILNLPQRASYPFESLQGNFYSFLLNVISQGGQIQLTLGKPGDSTNFSEPESDSTEIPENTEKSGRISSPRTTPIPVDMDSDSAESSSTSSARSTSKLVNEVDDIDVQKK